MQLAAGSQGQAPSCEGALLTQRSTPVPLHLLDFRPPALHRLLACTRCPPPPPPPPPPGAMTAAEVDETYKIGRRIEAEERCLDSALMVFTSTRQEVEQQWGL